MNLTKFQPLLENVELSDVRYVKSHPRSYRFDASKGIIKVKEETPLTKKGESFTIIPIAYRVFTDTILGERYGKRKWCEFFFLNQAQNVCALLLHGYSVDNLLKLTSELFYDDLKLSDVKLKINPEEKVNKAEGAKYFIAEFSYEEANKEQVQELLALSNSLEIYRAETFSPDAETLFSHGITTPLLDAPQ